MRYIILFLALALLLGNANAAVTKPWSSDINFTAGINATGNVSFAASPSGYIKGPTAITNSGPIGMAAGANITMSGGYITNFAIGTADSMTMSNGANITFNEGYIKNLTNGTAAQDAMTYSQLKQPGANISYGGYVQREQLAPQSVVNVFRYTVPWVGASVAVAIREDGLPISISTNNTTVINAAIDSLSNGGKVSLYDSLYVNRIDMDKPCVTLEGIGNPTLTAKTDIASTVIHVTASNCTMSGIVINGNRANMGGKAISGIWSVASYETFRDLYIQNCSAQAFVMQSVTSNYISCDHIVLNNNYFGIYLYDDVAYVSLHRIIASSGDYDAISVLHGSHGVYISDSSLINIYSGTGITIDGVEEANYDVHVDKTSIIGCGWHPYNGDGIFIKLSNDVTVSDCNIMDNGLGGIDIEDSLNTMISNCEIRNNGRYTDREGILLDQNSYELSATIIGTRIWDNQGTKTQSYGISANGDATKINATIIGNNVFGNKNGAMNLPNNAFSGSVHPPKTGGIRTAMNNGYNTIGWIGSATLSSGVAWYNQQPYTLAVYISGGTVSSIAVDAASLGLTSGMFLLDPGVAIVVTYSSPPANVLVGQ